MTRRNSLLYKQPFRQTWNANKPHIVFGNRSRLTHFYILYYLLVIAAAWGELPRIKSATKEKEQITVLYNTAYEDLIITVHTIITFSKQRMLFVSIQNAYKVNTVFQEVADMIL
jgi:hypothetical protein